MTKVHTFVPKLAQNGINIYSAPPGADYFTHRIYEQYGYTEAEARAYGIIPARDGYRIAFKLFTLDGQQIERLSAKGQRIRRKQERRRSDIHTPELDSHTKLLSVDRLNPKEIKTGKLKYLWPKGLTTFPVPGSIARKHYQAGTTGAAIAITEGALKAYQIERQASIPAFWVNGNQCYVLGDELKKYLLQCKPSKVLLMMDSDALEIRNKEGLYTSERAANFYGGAVRFAKEAAIFAKESGLKTSIEVVVNRDQYGKGIDDYLMSCPNSGEVIAELKEAKQDGAHFYRQRIPATKDIRKIEKALKQFFAITNHRAFYDRHGAEIGGKAFAFMGQVWQPSFLPGLANNKQRHTLQNDRYRATGGTESIKVNKYIAEQAEAITSALRANKRLCLNAPTGSGKTTFFMRAAKSIGAHVLIALPTRDQVKQLGADMRAAVAIYGDRAGNLKSGRLQAALNAEVVVCTYETVGQIEDIDRRLLVIDEAHNLVSQYGNPEAQIYFRAETLRGLLEKAETAKGLVLTSGTMPPLLAAAIGAKQINIERAQSPTKRINVVLAKKQSWNELLAATISEFRAIDWHQDIVVPVLVNNIERAEELAAQVVSTGLLTAEQIEVVTSEKARRGDCRAVNGISSKKQTIPKGLKLVITTSLLAEGYSIKNKNIHRLFAVNVNDPQLVRQFIARPRSLDVIPVTLVLKPQHRLGDSAYWTAGNMESQAERFERRKDEAELSIRTEQRALKARRAELENLEPEMSAYMDAIESAEPAESLLYGKDFYHTASGYKVDVLRILAGLRNEQIEAANVDYLLQHIEGPGIVIADIREAGSTKADSEAIKEQREDINDRAEEAASRAIELLQADPATFAAYVADYYRKARHKKYTDEMQANFPELLRVGADELADFEQRHSALIEGKAGRKIRAAVRAYCDMEAYNLDSGHRAELLQEFDPAKWRLYKKQAELLAVRTAYSDSYRRKTLPHIYRQDAKAADIIQKRIEAEQDGDVITSAQAKKAIQNAFSRQLVKDGKVVRTEPDELITTKQGKTFWKPKGEVVMERMKEITPKTAHAILERLFITDNIRTSKGNGVRIVAALQNVQNLQSQNVQNLHVSTVVKIAETLYTQAFWRKT